MSTAKKLAAQVKVKRRFTGLKVFNVELEEITVVLLTQLQLSNFSKGVSNEAIAEAK